MEMKIIKEEKDNLILQLNNQTIAEIARVYLNQDEAVQLVAWRREHPEKPVIFEIQTKGKSAKKALEDAIAKIEKDSEKLLEEFKKAK